jgi:hypothetical protein
LSEVPALIGVLADALGDAIEATPEHTSSDSVPQSSLVGSVRSWLRPKLATVAELRLVRDPAEGERSE